jgi:hypothetical protein
MEERAMSVSETATFRGDDPDCLVDAGLACRWCLSARVEWELELDPWEDRATGRCPRCARRETVALTRDQALRLCLRADTARAPAAPAVLRSGR